MNSIGPDRKITIGVVAGEASGDLLGAHLMNALKARCPDIEFVGIAGPKMQAAGARVLFPMDKLAVSGYVEVLRHYRELLGIRKQVRQHFLQQRPDLFIGIDAPDFNLALEASLKKAGVRTLHYVSPSIWAWRGERIHAIKEAVDHMLTLFPFEKPLYDQAGIPATYVGHPLADLLPMHPDRAGVRSALKLDQEAPIIALLPGSRRSEVERMGDTFVATMRHIHQQLPEAVFLAPMASKETRILFAEALARSEGPALPVSLLFGHAHEAMTAADVVLVASGTATLEAALLKRPMVITYKVSRLTYYLMKRKAYLPYVGLPNILAGEFIVPELLQNDATPEALGDAVLHYLCDREDSARLEARFAGIHEALRQDTSARAAAAVLRLLGRPA